MLTKAEKTKLWRKNNPEKKKEANKKYYEENKEIILSQQKEYKRGRIYDPIKKAIENSKRRNLIRANGGHYSKKEWVELCNLYGNRCLCCGEKKPLTPDHIIPIVLGGSGNIDNIQPLCIYCNKSKGKKVIDFRKSCNSRKNAR